MPRFDVLSGLPPYGEEAFPFRVAAEHPIAGDALTLKRSDAPETLLTCMCMTMFAEAFKLPCGQDILERLLRPKARGAARHALEFESLAGLHDNLQAPSRYLVEVMSGGLTVRGAEHIPTCGPVLNKYSMELYHKMYYVNHMQLVLSLLIRTGMPLS